jgi:hypothetical protein
VGIVLVMDDEATITNRNVYTVIEALSSTGGILGFVYISIYILISYIQEFLYNRALIKDIFLYQ